MLPPTYSRRRRNREAAGTDVYEYDIINQKIKIQVIQIIESAIGTYWYRNNRSHAGDLYDYIVKEMRRELGVHLLHPHAAHGQDELMQWLERAGDTEPWLDAVEYCLRGIDIAVRERPDYYHGRSTDPSSAIAEFNSRMQEAAIGYQYVSGEILRVVSMHLHKEVVLPVLVLLSGDRFAAAEQEYRSDHHAFRNGELEDCIVDCGKAFESVLKIIGEARG